MEIYLKEKTPLENACLGVLGKDYKEYYEIFANLLLLNPEFVQKNDPRLTAKITAILFDNELLDKPHLICQFIDNPELEVKFTDSELNNTKKLLRIDPELINTNKIIEILKQKKE